MECERERDAYVGNGIGIRLLYTRMGEVGTENLFRLTPTPDII